MSLADDFPSLAPASSSPAPSSHPPRAPAPSGPSTIPMTASSSAPGPDPRVRGSEAETDGGLTGWRTRAMSSDELVGEFAQREGDISPRAMRDLSSSIFPV